MKVESIEYSSVSLDSPVEKPKIRKDDNPKPLEIKDSERNNENKPISERSVIEAIEKANKVTLNHNTRAEFAVHEVTKDIMIKIIDTDKNEVIREFPPKKFLDLIAKLWDLAGIVVDERR